MKVYIVCPCYYNLSYSPFSLKCTLCIPFPSQDSLPTLPIMQHKQAVWCGDAGFLIAANVRKGLEQTQDVG